MSRKVFISFLGTNDYVVCNYFDEKDPSVRADAVKYVQEALIQMYCKDFGENDCYYFFLTEKARTANWENDGQWDNEKKKYNKQNQGLKARLDKLAPRGQVHDCDIQEGFSTEELWKIFEDVFAELQMEDEVVFDITHAFRSLPLLGLALLNYAKALKRINVNAIYYGAFERLGAANAVRSLPMEKRDAPVLNLLSVSELQDWTSAAFDFIEHGNVKKLYLLTNKRIQPVLKETKGADKPANTIRSIIEGINSITLAFATNRGCDVYCELDFDELKKKLNSPLKDDFIHPLRAIIDEIQAKVSSFSNNDPLHWVASAEWCANHQLYQQGITQLQEGLITWICTMLEPKNEYFKWNVRKPRGFISDLLNVISQSINSDNWKHELKGKKNFALQLVNNGALKTIAPIYSRLTAIRNDIQHGGYTDAGNAKTLVTKFKELFKELSELDFHELSQVLGLLPAGQSDPPLLVLLNLSNHPSGNWSDEQLARAKAEWREIVDMPFPPVPPAAMPKEIKELAEQYAERIGAIRPRPTAVHLMGEMTFTYALVRRLQEAGLRCVASTTVRDAKEEEEGVKKARFSFVQFRDYPFLD